MLLLMALFFQGSNETGCIQDSFPMIFADSSTSYGDYSELSCFQMVEDSKEVFIVGGSTRSTNMISQSNNRSSDTDLRKKLKTSIFLVRFKEG